MDPFEELEKMAMNAAQEPDPNSDITPSEIARWRKLFSYTNEQALDLIKQHNHDYTRTRLSDSQWDIIRTNLEARGYDRSAYEHELEIGMKRRHPTQITHLSAKQARAKYILKLEGPLSNPELVRVAAGLPQLPECIQGEGDDEDVNFCYLDGSAKQAISEWLLVNAAAFTPTFVHITQKAEKDLSTFSIYPTLGIDSTLPHNRACNHNVTIEPKQEQYPVWYFFYGTLAQSAVLSRQLGLSDQEVPILHPATITRGRIGRWGGKYKALVDAPAASVVEGSAYQVVSKEHEDALRAYETESYEVVRCTITFGYDTVTGYQEVKGCTFRFVGAVDGE